MVEIIAELQWLPAMLLISQMAVLSIECRLFQAYAFQWAAGQVHRGNETHAPEPLPPAPTRTAATAMQKKIPAFLDHCRDDDETSLLTLFMKKR